MPSATQHPTPPTPIPLNVLRAAICSSVAPDNLVDHLATEAAFIAHWTASPAYEPPIDEHAPVYWEQVTQIYLELLVEANSAATAAEFAAAPVAIFADIQSRLAALDTGRIPDVELAVRAATEVRVDAIEFIRKHGHDVEVGLGALRDRRAAASGRTIQVDRFRLWSAILAAECDGDEHGVGQMLRELLPLDERERVAA